MKRLLNAVDLALLTPSSMILIDALRMLLAAAFESHG
jgi:hypothetical protein